MHAHHKELFSEREADFICRNVLWRFPKGPTTIPWMFLMFCTPRQAWNEASGCVRVRPGATRLTLKIRRKCGHRTFPESSLPGGQVVMRPVRVWEVLGSNPLRIFCEIAQIGRLRKMKSDFIFHLITCHFVTCHFVTCYLSTCHFVTCYRATCQYVDAYRWTCGHHHATTR